MNLLAAVTLFGIVLPTLSQSNIEGCGDDKNFMFIQTRTPNWEFEYSDENVRKCYWISKRSHRIPRFCAYGYIQAACPKTCIDVFPCECQDDPDFTFQLENTKETVDCSWITTNKKKTHIRRLRYCYPGSPFYNEGHVGNSCKESCGFCTATYGPIVEKSPAPIPTQAPSPSMVPSDAQSMLPSSLPSDQPSGELTSVDSNECPYEDSTDFWWIHDFRNYRNSFRCSELIESEDPEETKDRRAKNCNIHEVMAKCPHACAICCNDNPQFKFTTPNGKDRKSVV